MIMWRVLLIIAFALTIAAPVFEWERPKQSVEREVAYLRWTVLLMGLAFLVFVAQAQIRFEQLSSLTAKSHHEQSAMPQLPQKAREFSANARDQKGKRDFR
jgi:phosphoglycerol transferase MdoB-like AlkP superfamily enzyme